MRVLVVDDDKNSRAMLRLSLSRAGFEVEEASDAERALEMLRRGSFDRLVVDGHMEPVGGFELARRARELLPDLPVLMVSGLYHAEDARGTAVARLFPKPVDVDSLAACLRTG